MPDTLGNITVPDFTDSGETFPIVPDWGYGYAQAPHVVIHQFGSGNAKIEQRFYQGTSAKRFTVRRARLTAPERVTLRDFYEAHTPYQSFTYNCPNDNGTGTTAHTVRFAEEPLSFTDLSDYICSTGVTLIEVPTTAPTYTLNSTVTRFPSAALATALLDQAQEIIPLVKIAPRESGYPAIYVSDRRCTIGTQLYIPRLLDFDGISQGISGESDQASFVFGNADRAMRDLANDTNLLRAGVEFSLFHVGTGIKLDLWKGEVVSWDMDAGPEFRLSCADGIYELTLPYPCRRISRTCWKSYNDAAGCPYATQSTGMDTTHFPTASVLSCDKSYDGANGCLAHGMKRYFGGIIAEPQTFLTGKIISGPMFTKSLIADSIYESVLPEIYCFNPSYKDENNETKYGMPVSCKLAAVREELDFFSGLGIVGEGPITFGMGHTLDGIYHHGQGTSNQSNGLRTVTGADPAGDMGYFSLDEIGNTTSVWWTPNWRKVYEPTPNKTYKDNFSAGTAFLTIRRNDDKGVQLSKVSDHSMEAIVKYGLQGWWWEAPGVRHWYYQTNPVWIAINMLLRAKGARYASVEAQETYFDVDAAIAAASICSTTVDKVIGTGTEVQFRYQGIVADERPLRDWITDVLMNCNGYYTWSFGKLKIGIRSNSSAVEAFTDGNILFRSLNLAPLRPSFNYLTGQFKDQEFRFQDNNVSVYDEDHAKLVGGSAAPLYLKAQIPLSGTSTKSQAARIVTTRLREELGGITAAQWRDARELSFRTTILSLAVEPGMVCSMTHADMPSGAGEFRVTGWRLNKDYSIDIAGRTTVDDMYDMTVGPKPADVAADPVPVETPVVESPFDRVYTALNADGTFADDSVTEDSIADGAVTEPKVGAGAVTEAKIGTGAVTEAKIGTGAVTAEKIAAAAIDITKCASSIRPPEILATLPAAGSHGRIVFLTSDNKLYRDTGSAWTSAVATADLSGTIATEQIASSAVTEIKLAASAVTAGKIATNAVTAIKISANAVTESKIAANAVVAGKIAANAVGADEIAALSITSGKIAADAVIAGKIAANAVGADEIAANSIIAGKIAANAVGADQLTANSVTAGKVAAGAIGATEIAANAITVKKLAVVPEGLQPDPAMQDESWWNRDQGWAFLTNDGSNLAYQMGVPKCLVQTGTSLTYAYCGTPEIPFAGVGQTTRMRYKAYNNSNQTMYLGVSYKRTNGSDISHSLATVAGTAGHVTGNVLTTVPAETVKIQFWCRTNGAGFSGTMAIAEWKLDIAASADLIVDGAITGAKILAGTLTSDHITVTTLSSLVANLGTVTAGTITGTTFRTAADGSGNYIELSGTTIKGKDSGGNEIWNMYPAQGPLALTPGADTSYQVAISTANFGNVGSIAVYDDTAGNPNTPEGMAAAIEAAWDYYAATAFTGKWNVTSLLPTAPRYVLVAINAVVSSSNKAELIAGPITPSATWQAIPGRWLVTFFKDNNAVRVGILGAVTDTRLIIVPVMKIGSSLFIHRSYSGSLTGVSGTIRIVGVFA